MPHQFVRVRVAVASRLRGEAPADVELEEVVISGGCRYVELGAFRYELIAEGVADFRVLDVGRQSGQEEGVLGS